MENKLRVFENEQFGKIRTINRDGEPWFVVADVCEYFGVTNRNRVMQDIDEDEKGGTQMMTPGGPQTVTIISEPGLYSLLFALQPKKARGVSDEYVQKRKTELQTFKRWITHEVIPTIRKTGGYVNNDDLFVETYFADANEEQKEMFRSTLKRIRTLNRKIEEDKPKVLLANAVSGSDNAISVADMAKILKQNGVDIGQKRFYEWLRDKGFLVKQAGISWNTPTQRGMDSGFFEIKEYVFVNGDKTFITKTTRVTGKGQQHFVKMFLEGRA